MKENLTNYISPNVEIVSIDREGYTWTTSSTVVKFS